MTDATTSRPVALAEQVNRNVKAAIARAGLKPVDIEHADALGMSHAGAMRRFSGKQDWKFVELEQLAAWLGINVDTLTTSKR